MPIFSNKWFSSGTIFGAHRMRRFGWAFPAALMLAACMAIYPQKASAMKDLHCEIRSRPVNGSVELTGVVWSDKQQATGDYSFIVNSQGPSGSSNVAQKGLFSVEPHHERVVGTVVVNARAGDRFLARLTINSDGEICTAEV